MKPINNMETTLKKINVRGAINLLKTNKTLKLDSANYKVSSVRATAGSVTADTGKTFTVSKAENTITVTRNS